jgi:hypothetical protein
MDPKLYSHETDCEKKMNPFDYINAISYTKNNLVHGTDNDELAESGYNPFLTNKGLSYYPDTVLYANEMNTKSQLDNAPQFDYLINSIRPKKRFSKWHKKTTDDDLMMIQQYYQCSYSKAEQALKALTKEQLSIIKTRITSIEEK